MLEIKQAQFLTSAVQQSQWPDDQIPEFCFVGRSNVGKSSFINTLVNQKNLARVSQTPGKTQVLNFFTINHNQFRFVDVPGYGFAKISKTKQEQFGPMMEEYLTTRKNLKAIFLLLDFRHPPSKDDILMWQYLSAIKVKTYFIATKVDKVSKNQYLKQKKLLLTTLALPSTTPLILFSSYQKIGIDDVLSVFEKNLNK
ncbi:MAG: ribosome biogenesis GTP-binding protein YihA/YsxC [Spiroplasma sp.]|nr:ribosome biogenesis GTP-binding protein YihA/YsxC [Spiroplasma sp.]